MLENSYSTCENVWNFNLKPYSVSLRACLRLLMKWLKTVRNVSDSVWQNNLKVFLDRKKRFMNKIVPTAFWKNFFIFNKNFDVFLVMSLGTFYKSIWQLFLPTRFLSIQKYKFSNRRTNFTGRHHHHQIFHIMIMGGCSGICGHMWIAEISEATGCWCCFWN